MQAAAKVGCSMSPSEIAMELKKRDSHLFSRMTPQVVGTWIDCSGTRPEWKKDVSERAEKYGNRPRPNITRKSILAPFPDIEEGTFGGFVRLELVLTMPVVVPLLLPDYSFLYLRFFRCLPMMAHSFSARHHGFTNFFSRNSTGLIVVQHELPRNCQLIHQNFASNNSFDTALQLGIRSYQGLVFESTLIRPM
jgi:hypothetical protein